MNQQAYWRTPLDLERWTIPHGRVVVLAERCKGCELCIEHCPEKMLTWSEDYNAKGYRYPVIVPGMEEVCVACGYCQSVCPDFAIYVVSELPSPESET
jgi:2-oxoglutarate ferredoxin oxidoreductase subunit delta